MTSTIGINDEQARLWNGPGGRGWVEAQDVLDAMLRPFQERLLQTVAVSASARMLDVGCGAGSTTIALSRLLGSSGAVVGVDISEPLLAEARARALREGSSAQFICADAQVYAGDAASFDVIVSRFGVMFFADPVQAFENLRRCARDGARLSFVAWRGEAENAFMTAAERAAAPLLPAAPPRQPDAPGQFAFADKERVCRILKESGWRGIEIEPVDVVCSAPRKDLERYLAWVGPVGRALQEAAEDTRARLLETILPAFTRFVQGEEVRFDAAAWLVRARA